jgi:hypothetical protein
MQTRKWRRCFARRIVRVRFTLVSREMNKETRRGERCSLFNRKLPADRDDSLQNGRDRAAVKWRGSLSLLPKVDCCNRLAAGCSSKTALAAPVVRVPRERGGVRVRHAASHRAAGSSKVHAGAGASANGHMYARTCSLYDDIAPPSRRVSGTVRENVFSLLSPRAGIVCPRGTSFLYTLFACVNVLFVQS